MGASAVCEMLFDNLFLSKVQIFVIKSKSFFKNADIVGEFVFNDKLNPTLKDERPSTQSARLAFISFFCVSLALLLSSPSDLSDMIALNELLHQQIPPIDKHKYQQFKG